MILLFFFLLIIPIILASPWMNIIPEKNGSRIFALIPIGLLIQMAIFQPICFIFSIAHFSFTSLSIAYSIIVLVCSVFAGRSIIRGGKKLLSHGYHLSKWELFYGAVFLVILCWQIYRALSLDRTYMSYDDSTYLAFASDALEQNELFRHDVSTGIGSSININRAIQSSLILPAFLSWLSGIRIVTISHTIMDIYYLIVTYLTFAFMGSMLFKKKEDVLVFLIFLSVLIIFGNYSIYSPSMRIIGLNYVGKAILSAFFFPCIYTLLTIALKESYNRKIGLLLLLLSLAASGMSLFGAVMMIATITICVCLSLFRKERNFQHIKYVLWSGVTPLFFVGVFFAFRYLI